MAFSKFRYREMARVTIQPGIDIVVSERIPGNVLSIAKAYRVDADGGGKKDMMDKDNKMVVPKNSEVLRLLSSMFAEAADDLEPAKAKAG